MKKDLRIVSITTEDITSFYKTNATDEMVQNAIDFANKKIEETDEHYYFFDDIKEYINERDCQFSNAVIKNFIG